MKNKLALLVGVAVLAILLVYMFTFQVRYDEVAVLTTFDAAREPQLDPETGQIARDASGQPTDPGSLITEPGLYFKAPWPIQRVYDYSTQLQLLEDRPQEIQTADGYAVIMKMYLAWRIEDPYAFFRSLQTVEEANSRLQSLLRNLSGVVSRYDFDQLVNTDAQRLKLQEIEATAADELRSQLGQIQPGYGIRVEQVGISRIILPEATTQAVFERMRKTRERMAEEALAEGRSQAATIKSRAESAAERILAFAQSRAQSIRDEGNREAAQYFAVFRDDSDFAVFLRQMDALREMLAHNTTFILDANSLWFLSPLRGEAPAAQQGTMDSAAHRQ